MGNPGNFHLAADAVYTKTGGFHCIDELMYFLDSVCEVLHMIPVLCEFAVYKEVLFV
jgi:hypothetical protein